MQAPTAVITTKKTITESTVWFRRPLLPPVWGIDAWRNFDVDAPQSVRNAQDAVASSSEDDYR